MVRNLAALLIVAWCSADALAADWAQKMFKVTRHDFEHVAFGAKTEYLFEVQNLYEEDVHLADVRTSCGCTTPSISKNTLKTWEKGEIVARFNTGSFIGQRAATITVTIDKPFFAEVQLNVSGFIHNDVEFTPGAISFGDVDQGVGAEKQVTVKHHGLGKWAVTDVRSANANLEVELSDAMRLADGVAYRMTVRLKNSAICGYINDSLSLVTDDPRLPTVPVLVEGRVVPALSVSPSPLFVGVVEPGKTVNKQIVVKAKKPCKILSIQCANQAFQFKPPTGDAKTIHLLPITFKAGETPGDVENSIEIETDLPAGGKTTCLVRGSIKAPEPAEPANPANPTEKIKTAQQ